MAIIDPDLIDPDAPPRVRGLFLVQKWRDKYVVRSWPKRGGPLDPYLRNWQRQQFSIAGQMAANPEPISLWTATEVVRGSPMVPRDFLTACAYGRGYIIVGPDGEEWPVIDHGPPKEEPEPPPVPFTGQWNGNIPLGTSGSGYASKGAIISPALSMQIEALAWPVEAVAGATYIGGIYRVNSSFEIEEVVAQSAPQTAPVSGYVIQFTPLPSLPIIGFNSLYAILHTRTDGSGNTSSGLHAGQYDAVGIPMEPMETYARVTSTNPAIGNTLDTGANPFAYLIKWF